MTRLKTFAGLWVLLGLLLSTSTTRAAEERVGPSQPHVIIIGVGQYADELVQPRASSEADAQALFDVLTSKDHLGVGKDHVRLLLSKDDEKRGSKKATKENILEAVRWAVKSAKREDLVVFAFFGQGASLGERGDRTCYLASDSTLKDRAKNAIAAAELAQEFDKLKSERLAVLLDVNFKGFDAAKAGIPEPTLGTTPYKEFLGDDGTEEHNPLPGRVIFLATEGLHPAVEVKGRGLVAGAITDALKGEADKDGYEPDGAVTVDELTTYLNKEVPELLRKTGLSAEDQRRGLHWVIGGQGSHFNLTRNPKASTQAEERLTKFQKLAKDRNLDKDLTEEGERLLARMPRLQAQRELRKAYQKLVDGKATVDEFKTARAEVLATTKLPADDSFTFARVVIKATILLDEEYVKEVNQGELVGFALRGLFRQIEEKIPEAIQEKLSDSKALKTMRQQELLLLLREARMALGKREDLEKGKDVDIALKRMMARLDPYTTYVDPETVERFKQEYRGVFSGIGVQIRKDPVTDQLQVVTPIKGSPSYRAGIQAGDLITTLTREVDSDGKPLEPAEVLPTKGLALNEAVKKILGKEGTRIKLTIQREGVKEPIEKEITRGQIELETVFGVKRDKDDGWEFMADPANKIAYVRLSSFTKNTTRDLADTVRQLKQAGMKGLVLDLRFNPGGLLTSAKEISDLFINDQEIVSIRPRVGRPFVYRGLVDGSETEFPMVVMVNGYSASASEIVSACLQDHKRAVVVGERSYGKGSVQNIADFEGGQIKYTTASFWRPSGKNLNKSSTGGKETDDWGVSPSEGYLVELTRKEREDLMEHQRNTEIIGRKEKDAPKTEFKDKQLEAALKYLREHTQGARKP